MGILLAVIIFVIFLVWLIAITIFVITQLKDLQTKVRGPQIVGFKYWSLVRFNPFMDTGSNQSFVLCLLNESKSGVILTNLHSRNGNRMYAKLVKSGKADTDLSEEEKKALLQANI